MRGGRGGVLCAICAIPGFSDVRVPVLTGRFCGIYIKKKNRQKESVFVLVPRAMFRPPRPLEARVLLHRHGNLPMVLSAHKIRSFILSPRGNTARKQASSKKRGRTTAWENHAGFRDAMLCTALLPPYTAVPPPYCGVAPTLWRPPPRSILTAAYHHITAASPTPTSTEA